MAADFTYEFGPYRLEVPARRLLRGGEVVALTPKAFDTLVALVERRDRVVKKAELMRLIWPDSFVEEANLSQTIFVLRKTLGEDEGGHQYIDTIPRHGYRFAAQVVVVADSSPTGAARPGGIGKTAMMLAAGVAMVAIGVAAWMARGPGDSSDVVDSAPTRVAVLPFENLTRDPQDDWLAGAFSNSLTSSLQEFDTLIPVSRDRIVEWYQRQGLREASAADAVTLAGIARALDVRYFVHGSYQRIGNRIRVTAQLVSASDGAIRAQETVTDDFANLLTLEDDLAARFSARLAAASRPKVADARTQSLDAYQATIEGQTLYAANRFSDAVVPLTRATTIDPNYAPAWALLGKAFARMSTISSISSGSATEHRQRALSHASRAIELAPQLYDAHVAMALAAREMEDVERWRAASLKAIELNANVAEAHALVADSYFAGNAFGCRRDRDPERAEQYYRTAISLDPRWAPPYSNLSYQFSWLGREPEALTTADQGVAAAPGPILSRARAHALIRLGRADEAERQIRDMHRSGVSVSGQDHLILGSVALARGNATVAAREFETTLARLPTSSFHLAIARAYLEGGRLPEGLRHLEQSIAIERSCLAFIETTPAFGAYRAQPAFMERLASWRKAAGR